MNVTLKLNPETEADLLAQARAAGLPIDEFLTRQVEVLAHQASPSTSVSHVNVSSESWEKELDEWLDSFPQQPVLSSEALKRENWYPDRW